MKQYGKAGIITHYSCSVVFVSLFFTATTYGVDTAYWMNRAKRVFTSHQSTDSANQNDTSSTRNEYDEEIISEKTKWLTNLAVSIACYKLIFPVRAMLTTALTPMFIRYLRKNHPSSYLLK